LDCVNEDLPEAECSDSDNKTAQKSGTLDNEQSGETAPPVISGWHDVK
jgi:hypothetical protein